MFFIYTIAIRIYYILALLASFFNKKARDWVQGRKNQLYRIDEYANRWKNSPIVWIHAASYGEFEMSRPIIKSIQEKRQKTRFIVSFYSPSGFKNIQLDENYFLKIYLPLDIMPNHKRIINLFDLRGVIFIKYEFWYNFLRQLQVLKVPYYFTSLHLNKDAYIFKPLFISFKRLLLNATKIFCHNPTSFEILSKNGFKNISVFGDSRIEQALKNKQNIKDNISFNNARKTIIFGSATEYEMPYIIEFCNKHIDYNYILATHDVSLEYLTDLSNKLTLDSCQLSRISSEQRKFQIVLVDTYGDLKYLYNSADMAYIGAGFEKGPHNVLEPLVFGIPTFTGPNIKKFPMAQYLEQRELLFIIKKIVDLDEILVLFSQLKNSKFELNCKTFFNSNHTKIEEFTNHLNLAP